MPNGKWGADGYDEGGTPKSGYHTRRYRTPEEAWREVLSRIQTEYEGAEETKEKSG